MRSDVKPRERVSPPRPIRKSCRRTTAIYIYINTTAQPRKRSCARRRKHAAGFIMQIDGREPKTTRARISYRIEILWESRRVPSLTTNLARITVAFGSSARAREEPHMYTCRHIAVRAIAYRMRYSKLPACPLPRKSKLEPGLT